MVMALVMADVQRIASNTYVCAVTGRQLMKIFPWLVSILSLGLSGRCAIEVVCCTVLRMQVGEPLCAWTLTKRSYMYLLSHRDNRETHCPGDIAFIADLLYFNQSSIPMLWGRLGEGLGAA